MAFSNIFDPSRIAALASKSMESNSSDVARVLSRKHLGLEDFATLISPAATSQLELLCARSSGLTRRRFGRAIRLFAPLYLSNECINICRYCGFSGDNPIRRVTLAIDDVVQEAQELVMMGFRNLLLVSGEHPKFVSNGYLEHCLIALRPIIPSLSIEVAPMEIDAYGRLVAAGSEGLVVYQETYDRDAYSKVHISGPKRDFDWRLDSVERGYEAGFRRLGIGALFGLSPWREEAIGLASHALHLLKYCWKSHITLSLPRLRPCAGSFQSSEVLPDQEFTQLIAALRLLLPDVGIVLSTREPAWLREGLIPLGVTLISAGSHTEPGGYTGAGKDKVILKTRASASIMESSDQTKPATQTRTTATEQFNIADERSPAEMAEVLVKLGLDPVWKDWDQTLTPEGERDYQSTPR